MNLLPSPPARDTQFTWISHPTGLGKGLWELLNDVSPVATLPAALGGGSAGGRRLSDCDIVIMDQSIPCLANKHFPYQRQQILYFRAVPTAAKLPPFWRTLPSTFLMLSNFVKRFTCVCIHLEMLFRFWNHSLHKWELA